jgi:membrane-associated protease RseP (regulator of RpoE activity)
MTLTYLFFTVFLVSIILHELGHALAMKKHGIEINRISIFGLPPFIKLFHSNYFQCDIGIGLIPYGAFVEKKHVKLDLHDVLSNKYLEVENEISLAGPKMNFLLAALGSIGLVIIALNINKFNVKFFLICIATLIICLSMYSNTVNKFLICYIYPPLAFAYTVCLILPSQLTKNASNGMFSVIHTNEQIDIPIVYTICILVVLINLLLGILNSLPISFVDGGKVLQNHYSNKGKFAQKILNFWFYYSTLVLLVSLLSIVFGDIKNLYQFIKFW